MDIGSTLRRHWIEVVWGAFALANVLIVAFLGNGETVPFHFVWVSLTLVYGLRMWGLRTTLIVLAVVSLVSAAALLHMIVHFPNGPGLDEMAEVPLMATIFVAMVFYTERTKAATAAQQRMIERERDFVRDASHELRTPITIARGHVELLREAAVNPSVISDADIALDEIKRLGSISERLLILAAAEHEDFLDLEPLQTEPFLERLMRRWEGTASRDWQLRTTVEGWLAADHDRLELAMDSLIENAVKFTSTGDRIDRIGGTARRGPGPGGGGRWGRDPRGPDRPDLRPFRPGGHGPDEGARRYGPRSRHRQSDRGSARWLGERRERAGRRRPIPDRAAWLPFREREREPRRSRNTGGPGAGDRGRALTDRVTDH